MADMVLCGTQAPHEFEGRTGECDRPQGHEVRVGVREPGEPDDVTLLHAAHLDDVTLYWSEPDSEDRNEIRASAEWAALSAGRMRLVDPSQT